MNRLQLEHIIRVAGDIAGDDEIVILGQYGHFVPIPGGAGANNPFRRSGYLSQPETQSPFCFPSKPFQANEDLPPLTGVKLG